ncbi:MAG: 50S ribosomal protein L29 [Candidatus Diapherotrites archaeon]|uniref:Large ribosomal subunit protein uL29 n=1 Tax=Candidatus Iainarchaeum sp. TaxID=3101447 RepID=A0A8T3YPN2_9ARCH|nr:50S ribosomal protein L29 [Candidatus Diapherotrites archaeon]
MGSKKLAVLRDNSTPELEAKIVDLKSELVKERALISSGTRAEKPAKIRNARRQVARILTIINEKKAKKHGKDGRGD